MPEFAPLDLPDDPKLVDNIAHFARALRAAGVPVGPGRVLEAVRAVNAVGFSRREDFYHTLRAVLISRAEHRTVFNQCFRLFWRDPRYFDHMMGMLTPSVRGTQDEHKAAAAAKRASEALLDGVLPEAPETEEDGTEIEIDASATMSAQERLRTLDFEQMSAQEMAKARLILSRLRLPVKPLLTRRSKPGAGRLADWRSTLRQSARRGDVEQLLTRKRQIRPPDLVVLCDISGSMSAYSRAVLHFVHAVANRPGDGWGKIHAFTFGTRLTNITRHMAARDVDAALAAAGAEAQDWEGGTRIASCLSTFNRDWGRRVLSSGAVVLLITDGLDRDPGADLGPAMARLGLMARAVVWLNPLLRWQGFAPKAMGIRAMLPHVTSFRAGHNIASLEGLALALAGLDQGGDKPRLMRALSSQG